MTLSLILLFAAIICFVLSAVGVGGRVNLVSIGLACFAGSFLAGGVIV